MKPKSRIELEADRVRRELGLSLDCPVPDVIQAVQSLGYLYGEEDLGDEFSGSSGRIGGNDYLIAFNNRHNWSSGFKRFTISHELGHLSLPWHRKVIDGIRHFSLSEYRSGEKLEREADEFAAAFLAPRNAVKPLIYDAEFTSEDVSDLANQLGISFLSAAFRFIEFTDLACALIVVESDGVIAYERRSDVLFSELPHSSISRTRVRTGTILSDFISDPSSDTEGVVEFSEWYPDLLASPATFESVRTYHPDRYLAFLTPESLDFEKWIDA